MNKPIIMFVILGLIVSFTASCSQDQIISPSITPTLTVTYTVTPSATSTTTSSPSATPTITPTPTRNPDWITYGFEDVEIAYPSNWTVEDRSQDPKCIPGVLDCVLRITAPGDPETHITLVQFDFSFVGTDVSVTEIDDGMWVAELYPFKEIGMEEEVIVVSKEEVQVGGKNAIKRVFHEPLIRNNTIIGTVYIIRVLVINNLRIYHLYLTTHDVDEFDQYKVLMDALVSSLVFK